MTNHHQSFDRPPSVLLAYAQMLRPRGGTKTPQENLPELSATLHRVMPEYSEVRAYEAICGLPHAMGSGSQRLPLIYPQIMAAPLHMRLLAHPDFPLPGAGLVHVRNSITRHAALPLYERFDVSARLGESREVDAGLEFDILTTLHTQREELLWEATTTILKKSKKSSSSTSKTRERVPFASSIEDPEVSTILSVPADQGRKYAAVCKDYNPIHLHTLTAKLFGFERAIAHGMWVLGRSVGELADWTRPDDLDAPCTLDVSFKRPVFLPSQILLTARSTQKDPIEHVEIAVTTRDGAIPHLRSTLSFHERESS